MSKDYYSGTSGLLLPVPNKEYYPKEFREKSRLQYYSSLMNSIEINSSFYKIPQGNTVKKWAEQVPENFLFTFKLFKGITHGPQLGFQVNEVSKFMEIVSNVGHKRGCILVQFPPSIRINNFRQISSLINELHHADPTDQWNIALEFRHPSLYVDEIYELLNRVKFTMVIHDKGTAPSPLHQANSAFRYLRFHGPDGNYKGSYTDDVLFEYASIIGEWLSEGKQVFTYFNNTMGDAYGNLQTLMRFVKEQK